MQALGIAGDNVTGDAVTHFAKMGNGPGCARRSFVKRVTATGYAESSFTQWIMAEASGEC